LKHSITAHCHNNLVTPHKLHYALISIGYRLNE